MMENEFDFVNFVKGIDANSLIACRYGGRGFERSPRIIIKAILSGNTIEIKSNILSGGEYLNCIKHLDNLVEQRNIKNGELITTGENYGKV